MSTLFRENPLALAIGMKKMPGSPDSPAFFLSFDILPALKDGDFYGAKQEQTPA